MRLWRGTAVPSIPGGPQRRYPLLAASAADPPSVGTPEKWVCPSTLRGPESGQAGQEVGLKDLALSMTSPFLGCPWPTHEWDGAPASWGCLEFLVQHQALARAWHRLNCSGTGSFLIQ